MFAGKRRTKVKSGRDFGKSHDVVSIGPRSLTVNMEHGGLNGSGWFGLAGIVDTVDVHLDVNIDPGSPKTVNLTRVVKPCQAHTKEWLV